MARKRPQETFRLTYPHRVMGVSRFLPYSTGFWLRVSVPETFSGDPEGESFDFLGPRTIVFQDVPIGNSI